MKRKFYCAILLILLFYLRQEKVFSQASNISFPKEITASTGEIITIYQPQPESISGNEITGRSALSIRKTAKDEPVFGAIFYKAMVSTDKDTRLADLQSLKITNAKFPGIEDTATVKRLIKTIETEVPKWSMWISLDALVSTIEKENAEKSDEFNNNPPVIYYRNKPTTMVYIDGDPKIQKDKDLDAERVVNSPSLIFKEGSLWNLYTGGVWYKSAAITEGWVANTSLSKKLKSVDEQVKKQEAKNNEGKAPAEKPKVTDILVVTKPSELLQTDGEPNYKNVQGTSLLYASNTTNQIFKDINSQKTYTLLSGRWYNAPSIEGPWEYVPSDKLPTDFAKIPEGSEKDEVLASVAGTDAAEDAKIDAQIPQTAKVDRKTATVTVKYDGSPKFKKIEGTSLQLAENANVTVMKDADGKYFALDNGVWFTSKSANGPWAVADERPKEVDKIPPSSSAYNTQYVYVYESTPQYVYVGYTPGYMGCYIYGPTVVYGTGFYYPPWFGAVYYPHPVTWGFGFSYNPWMGWSMNFGFSTGYMHIGFSFGFGYGGWYGPPRYYPPYRPPYYGGGGYYGGGNGNTIINGGGGNTINIGGGGGNNNVGNGNRPTQHDRNNLYKGQNGVSTMDVKPGQSFNDNRGGNRNPGNPQVSNGAASNRPANVNNQLPNNNRGGGQAKASTRDANNVYADRNGNVYQKDNNGNWNQRDNKSNTWKSTSKDNPSMNNLNRESQARDRGNTRTNNFNQQRSAPQRSAPRGGGGGRRR